MINTEQDLAYTYSEGVEPTIDIKKAAKALEDLEEERKSTLKTIKLSDTLYLSKDDFAQLQNDAHVDDNKKLSFYRGVLVKTDQLLQKGMWYIKDCNGDIYIKGIVENRIPASTPTTALISIESNKGQRQLESLANDPFFSNWFAD